VGTGSPQMGAAGGAAEADERSVRSRCLTSPVKAKEAEKAAWYDLMLGRV
jgi:hypothetical protein